MTATPYSIALANPGRLCFAFGQFILSVAPAAHFPKCIRQLSALFPSYRLLPATAMLLPCEEKSEWMGLGDDLDFKHQPSECDEQYGLIN